MAGTEERLVREADTFGQVLERLRGRISPVLIGGPGWERLLDRARDLPATVAALPFGFELPLHEQAPNADFGVSLIGGSRSAAFFEERSRSRDATLSTAGIGRLLGEMGPEDSPLRRVAGKKMLLEYDIDRTLHGARPEPGLFLYPDSRTLIGDGQRMGDVSVMLDAVSLAAGQTLPNDERREAERVYMALTPETGIRSVGTIPSRGKAIRLAMTGFRTADDVTGFLERAGWPGRHATAADTIARLRERDAFAYMGVHFDMGEGGVGPRLGLSFFAREAEWLKDVRYWAALIDGIGEQGLAVPEKLPALAKTSSGSETLFARSGAFVLMRGIHHIKFVLSGDRIEQVKAYVFLLMMAPPSPDTGTAGYPGRAPDRKR